MAAAGLRFSDNQIAAALALASDARFTCLFGGARCVSGDTVLDGHGKTISELARIGAPVWVRTSFGGTLAEAPFRKGCCRLIRVETESGRAIEVTPDHRFWDGSAWVPASSLSAGSLVAVRLSEKSLLGSSSDPGLSRALLDDQHWRERHVNSQCRYFAYCRRYGQRLRREAAYGLTGRASRFGALAHIRENLRQFSRVSKWRGLDIRMAPPSPRGEEYNRNGQPSCRPSTNGAFDRKDVLPRLSGRAFEQICESFPGLRKICQRFLLRFCLRESYQPEHHVDVRQSAPSFYPDEPCDTPSANGYTLEKVLVVSSAANEQDYYTLHVPVVEQYYANGFLNHNSGKTFLIVRAIILRALKAPGSRHLIARLRHNAVWTAIAGDANATLFTVAAACFGDLQFKPHRQDAYFELPNGSTIWLGGLDDKERVDKILGREYVTIYLNEASEIPYSSVLVAMTRLAEVRSEIRQRGYIDLNPVGKSHWTHRMFLEHCDPVSRQPYQDRSLYASAALNPGDNIHNLTPEFLVYLDGLPEKQRKRFLEGVYVDEVEGALWTYDAIEAGRRALDDIPEAARAAVVIGVDPSGAGSQDDTNADEIGITAGARGLDGHGYLLADRSARCGPAEWARIAVNAFHEFRADCIVAERNFGGAMVEATIRAADRNVPVRLVAASRGKVVRAEPISALYEQNMIHHVGRYHELEDQLCAFSASGYCGKGSPDRADSWVWTASHLMLGLEMPIAYTGVYRHM